VKENLQVWQVAELHIEKTRVFGMAGLSPIKKRNVKDHMPLDTSPVLL
jgi:hypothetical protein